MIVIVNPSDPNDFARAAFEDASKRPNESCTDEAGHKIAVRTVRGSTTCEL